MIIQGRITKYSQERKLLGIVAAFDQPWLLEKQAITDVEIRISDGRCISGGQRRAVYSLIGDISAKTGYFPEECKEWMKYLFIAQTGHEYFSLSDCDMTTGRQFIRFLIDLCLEQDVPTRIPLAEWIEGDCGWYVYRCLVHKRCCVTQKKAQLHHVDAIGMGRDRNDVIHKGMRVLPLFWKKHAEAHTLGGRSFEQKYHVCAIKMDDALCEIWGVKSAQSARQSSAKG